LFSAALFSSEFSFFSSSSSRTTLPFLDLVPLPALFLRFLAFDFLLSSSNSGILEYLTSGSLNISSSFAFGSKVPFSWAAVIDNKFIK
jgi:hypothetical protein